MKSNFSFEGLGWMVRLQEKKNNYFLTLVREIVLGNALRKGDPLYYYLADCGNRKAVMIFLDGKERPGEGIIKIQGRSFMINTK